MDDEQSTFPDSKDAMDIGDPLHKPGAKRRASRAGTRSVASLTPEQLARKRANDREAQRSIRQRTKTHIEELEQRIRDLSQDQEARDFEQMKRRNMELEEELRHLRELLGRPDGSVASSPELDGQSSRYGIDIPHEANASTYSSYSASWSRQASGGLDSSYPSFPSSSAGDLLSSFAPDYSGLPSGFSDPGSAKSDTFNDTEFEARDLATSPSGPIAGSRRGAPSSRPQFGRSRSYPHGRFGMPASSNPPLGLSQPPLPTSHPLTLNQNKLQNLQINSNASPQSNSTAYEVAGAVPALPAWECTIPFLPPTGPMDNILITLLQRQRSLASEDTSGRSHIGPRYPDLRALMNPDLSSQVHPVTSVISELFNRVKYTGFAENVACFLLVYHFVQWQIWPTMETYHTMPDWYCPRPSQFLTPHPILQSLLCWGKLRDVVIGNQAKYATDEFMSLVQNCASVNWPYRDEDILVYVGEEVRITDMFVRHVETQANWSLGEAFQRRYPELRDVCKFADLP